MLGGKHGGCDMNIKWVFLNVDGSKVEATTDEPNVPVPGDGKWFKEKPYVVRYVVVGRTTGEEPIAIANEYQPGARTHA